jgi:DNA polymerase epsilon subunit 2
MFLSFPLCDLPCSESDGDAVLAAILDQVCDRIERREIQSSVIDREAIAAIVAFMTSTDDDLNLESTELYNAFNSPRIDYDERLKTYNITAKPQYQLHGPVESRARMFRERLLFTQQRLLRTGEFCLKGMNTANKSQAAANASEKHELSTVESLLGDMGSVRVLLGMLTQQEEGVWYIEDLTSAVPIDLSTLRTKTGLITEGCIVVVEGVLADGVFKIQVIYVGYNLL